MRAYVIKNKEGKYYSTYWTLDDIWTNDIFLANKYADNKTAINMLEYVYKISSVKPLLVPITIAEGDLEKEIRKQVCDEVRKVIDYCSEWYEQGYVIDMREDDLQKEIDKIEQAKESADGK